MTTTRRLGRSDLEVSALGLGCWPIGGSMLRGDEQLGYSGADDAESLRALATAAERGATLFDTANAYGAGHSERLLGEAFGDEPAIRIATKFGNTVDEATRQLTGQDVTPDGIRRQLRESLERLRRDRIDLFQLHTPEISAAEAEDLAATLEDAASEGLIAWWGVSTDDPARITPYLAAPHFAAVQLQLNVLDDASAALALAEEHDLAVLCRSPLAMGLLGGRYTADTTLPADDVRRQQPDWLTWFEKGVPRAEFLERMEAVRGILTSGGRSLAQGALAWIWARSDRAVPLPGFRTVEQVEDTTAALDRGPLTPEQFAAVERALGRS